jgi:outer membrane protein TolC
MNVRHEHGRAAQSLVPAALVSLALGLGGCTVGPDYRTPQIETGEGWSEPVSGSASEGLGSPLEGQTEVDLDGWWRSFGDPTLDRLVEQAVEQSLDLREAAARVAEARALRDRAAGGRYPTIGAQASLTQRAQSENGALPIDRIPDLDREQTLYDVGFDAG